MFWIILDQKLKNTSLKEEFYEKRILNHEFNCTQFRKQRILPTSV